LIAGQTSVTGLTFSRDGSTLAGCDGTVKFWNLQDGQLSATLLFVPAEGENAMNWIVYTPGGQYDASPDAQQWIRWRSAPGADPQANEDYAREYSHPGLLAEILKSQAGQN
jgi:WD40 repeat protein